MATSKKSSSSPKGGKTSQENEAWRQRMAEALSVGNSDAVADLLASEEAGRPGIKKNTANLASYMLLDQALLLGARDPSCLVREDSLRPMKEVTLSARHAIGWHGVFDVEMLDFIESHLLPEGFRVHVRLTPEIYGCTREDTDNGGNDGGYSGVDEMREKIYDDLAHIRQWQHRRKQKTNTAGWALDSGLVLSVVARDTDSELEVLDSKPEVLRHMELPSWKRKLGETIEPPPGSVEEHCTIELTSGNVSELVSTMSGYIPPSGKELYVSKPLKKLLEHVSGRAFRQMVAKTAMEAKVDEWVELDASEAVRRNFIGKMARDLWENAGISVENISEAYLSEYGEEGDETLTRAQVALAWMDHLSEQAEWGERRWKEHGYDGDPWDVYLDPSLKYLDVGETERERVRVFGRLMMAHRTLNNITTELNTPKDNKRKKKAGKKKSSREAEANVSVLTRVDTLVAREGVERLRKEGLDPDELTERLDGYKEKLLERMRKICPDDLSAGVAISEQILSFGRPSFLATHIEHGVGNKDAKSVSHAFFLAKQTPFLRKGLACVDKIMRDEHELDVARLEKGRKILGKILATPDNREKGGAVWRSTMDKLDINDRWIEAIDPKYQVHGLRTMNWDLGYQELSRLQGIFGIDSAKWLQAALSSPSLTVCFVNDPYIHNQCRQVLREYQNETHVAAPGAAGRVSWQREKDFRKKALGQNQFRADDVAGRASVAKSLWRRGNTTDPRLLEALPLLCGIQNTQDHDWPEYESRPTAPSCTEAALISVGSAACSELFFSNPEGCKRFVHLLDEDPDVERGFWALASVALMREAFKAIPELKDRKDDYGNTPAHWITWRYHAWPDTRTPYMEKNREKKLTKSMALLLMKVMPEAMQQPNKQGYTPMQCSGWNFRTRSSIEAFALREESKSVMEEVGAQKKKKAHPKKRMF